MTTDTHRPVPPGRPSALRWLAPALVLTLAGCAAGGGRTTERDPMAALEQRALARWQLLIERQPQQAYEYLTPGYRSTRTVADYQGRPSNPALQWTGISWHQAECERPDSCQAKLLLDYEFAAPGAGKIPGIQELTERWLLIDGTWFHLPSD